MEHLSIQSFLVFHEFEFEVRGFNVIIGPQAAGKSLAVKLLYFFRSFLDRYYFDSAWKGEDLATAVEDALHAFNSLFPRYTWETQEFEIRYRLTDEVALSLAHRPGGKLSMDLSTELRGFHADLSADLSKKRDSQPPLVARPRPDGVKFKKRFSANPVTEFVPATRAIFPLMQKSIFTLLTAGATLDPWLQELGATYEMARQIHLLDPRSEGSEFLDAARAIMRAILRGDYAIRDGQDWIDSREGSAPLSHASSGQQEALPMLLILTTLPFLKGHPERTFIIEEPEAHLFPEAQKSLVELLAFIRDLGHRIVITTHSPYILTAINNLLLAGELVNQGKVAPGEVEKVIGGGKPLRYEDTGAWLLDEGTLEDIRDPETRLIRAEAIDQVSNVIEETFNRLLDLETGTE